MRRLIVAFVAVACTSFFAPNASAGFGLLHRGCCDAAPSCGCEAPAPVCCEAPAPTCCDSAPSCHGGLLKGIFGKLHAKIHCGKSACDAAPSCGCEAPAPSCGCEAPAPSCGCEAPAPTCCAAPAPAPTCCAAPAPSCGCEAPTCCEPDPCCKSRKHVLMGLLSKLKHKKCCKPTCCDAPAPSCGCEVAAPSCGCGS
jgi:hypothetical protein